MTDKEIVDQLYGNRVRVRVCGICIEEDKILLIHHTGVGALGSLWAPPGGGLNYGESAEQTLIREYKEETGLDVKVKEFLFVNEYTAAPLHAVELFFRVETTGGFLAIGTDPEMPVGRQIIRALRFWTFQEIAQEAPLLFHSALRKVKNLQELTRLKGYFKNL